jgi:hypothetical protein
MQAVTDRALLFVRQDGDFIADGQPSSDPDRFDSPDGARKTFKRLNASHSPSQSIHLVFNKTGKPGR